MNVEQTITYNWVLQRFLYTSQSLSDKDKGRLQKEILDTIFAESKIVLLFRHETQLYTLSLQHILCVCTTI